MKKTFLIILLLFAICAADPKKLSKSRSSSSSRGSSKKTGYNPQPTSTSHSAPASAPKPSLFGWQEKPAQRKQAPPRQSPQPKQTQTHSYPSSNTGLSGTGPAKQPTHQQDNVQKSAASQQSAALPQSNSQSGHSYPASNGLSGNSGSAGYPQQQSGLSGTGSGYPQGQGNRPVSGAGYPQQQGGLSGSAGAAPPPYSSVGGNYHSQGSPPAYSNSGNYPKQPPPYSPGNNYHQPAPHYSQNNGGYGSYGGHGYNPVQTPQMPGYFGNYGNNGRGGFGGVGRSRNILTGVGIAGAGVGTILTGLALWNLARSTGHHHHTVIYDNRGQPVAVAPNNGTEPAVDPILGDLVNCTLTISTDNATEVLSIPCAIATSFTPEADVKEENANNNPNDNTKCTVTVVTKAGREFLTTIPCSTLLNTAAENNVTEPPILKNDSEIINSTMNVVPPDSQTMNIPIQPTALPLADAKLNCSLESGTERDPINPCYAIVTNLTVIPLDPNIVTTSTTPASA